HEMPGLLFRLLNLLDHFALSLGSHFLEPRTPVRLATNHGPTNPATLALRVEQGALPTAPALGFVFPLAHDFTPFRGSGEEASAGKCAGSSTRVAAYASSNVKRTSCHN